MGKPPYEPPLVVDGRFPPALAREQDRVAIGAGEWQALDFEASGDEVRFDLGRTRLALRGAGPVLGRALAERWGGFLAGAGTAPDGPVVRVALCPVERLGFETPVAIASWESRGEEVLAKMRGLLVRVDPAAGRAAARVETARPTQELANLVRLLLAAFSWRSEEFLLRAAAVRCGPGLALLLGPAHAGKSTAARLAHPRPVVTDDALLVRREGERMVGLGVGLRGAEGSDGIEAATGPVTAEVAGLFVLAKAAHNRVRRLGRAEAALAIVAAASTIPGRQATRAVLAWAEEAARRIPVFRLEFHNRDGSLWETVESALAGSL